MRETDADVVELTDMDGPVLTALVSALYGKLTEIPSAIALPLFLAADAYQVGCHTLACIHVVITWCFLFKMYIACGSPGRHCRSYCMYGKAASSHA